MSQDAQVRTPQKVYKVFNFPADTNLNLNERKYCDHVCLDQP